MYTPKQPFTRERAEIIYEIYAAKYHQAEMLGENLEAQKSFITQLRTLQNNPEWVKRTDTTIATILLKMDRINIASTDAITEWIQTSLRPAMWPRIESFVESYADQDPNYGREALQEAYEDLQTLADIRDKLVNDYEYRSAMIALIWAATGDNDIVHRLYSPPDGTEDSTSYNILFEAAKVAD